ncbi:NUDIX hydrolase [Terrabacter sp. MAHUQ-38]|jgi:8-oxo-dGTP pyrophosphatase MutT (NUDIX family)|uniref:NUDIX hydrolase n=1 Tax=unclassified Terrabacter TaxID=2630222 RepID=UPI00165E8A0E|nr:NUDIX domain-containing protein [Terrabacter sp. MAHUQ-38]MBC9821987.1 NUDIX domain-containing protein [Terrabacter sp. MAHUQ-38]
MRTNVPGGIRLVALGGDDERLVELALGHGEHPEVVLGAAGWMIEAPAFATLRRDGALELGFRVGELDGIPPRSATVRRDVGVGDDEVGEPYQRVAAYAVVTSARGVLLTQFNTQTHVAGDWGLPGGGLDAGESPVDGLHREVWEETGQVVELGPLVEIQSHHWVGRAPNGVVEDFHAVRLIYRATCASPADPVIHDIGGTTSDARWFSPEQIVGLPMPPLSRSLTARHGPLSDAP